MSDWLFIVIMAVLIVGLCVSGWMLGASMCPKDCPCKRGNYRGWNY